MPLDGAGKYRMNPQVAGMHSQHKPDPGEQHDKPEHGGGAHKIEVHKKTEGGYDTVTHHKDGSSPAHHGTLEEVHAHMKQHFGEETQKEEAGEQGLTGAELHEANTGAF